MIPTGEQIADEMRKTYLGELEIPGGQLYIDANIQNAIGTAVRLLYDQLMRIDDRKVRRTAYYNLPAYTTYLTPADMGIDNMGAPKELWDRKVGSTWSATVLAINVATATTPRSVSLTITAHGLSTGAEVVAFNFLGMTPDMGDIWHIEAVDADTIKLLGCAAQASSATPNGVGSTGVISNSTEDYPRDIVTQLLEAEPRRIAPVSNLTQWAWKDAAFRFSPCSTARQLRISYQISGDYGSDLTLSVGINNSMEFLACYASGLAANARGSAVTAEKLFTLAVGDPSGDPKNADMGYLGALTRPQVNAEQNVRMIIPPFRNRRNTGFPIGY